MPEALAWPGGEPTVESQRVVGEIPAEKVSEVMYAVIETGGKQYRVEPGVPVYVETLAGEPGAAVEFTNVLAVKQNDELLTGAAAKGFKVTGTIEQQGRGDKVIVFKFKRKKQYKRTIGHRQNFTKVKVESIQG
jgi:large subunit ribosomal protein L21